MLSVSRSIVRQFHKILRQSGFSRQSRSKVSVAVRLIANQDGLTLLAVSEWLALSLEIPGDYTPEMLVVPLSCLAASSERSEGDVTFRLADKRITASWTDRNVPVEREYDSLNPEKLLPILPEPDQWSENPPALIDALRDAMRTTDLAVTRYALNCLQLNGKDGLITATDSHQVLIQRGFVFPWQDSLLIPTSKVFESAVLPHDLPIEVGKSEKHVHFRIGQWQIAFTIQTDGRFPDVQRIIPDPSAIETRLNLDPNDARFLVDRLDQLPMEDSIHRPVTVDLNGSVAIRSRKSPEEKATELVLSRSNRIGNEIRIATDRKYLKRAVDLGFSELGIASKNGPAICQDARRQFLWALLENAAVSPTDEAHRVSSASEVSPADSIPDAVSPTSSQIVAKTRRRSRNKCRPVPSVVVSNPIEPRKPFMPKSPDGIPTEADLINQLLGLRTQLHTIGQSIVTIARHLRARRKQQQLMKATLASLKQLQTLNV